MTIGRWCLVALLTLGGLSCDRQGSDAKQADGDNLLLFCGAGIQPPVAELIDAFASESGIQIEADYAGSEVLLSRIRLNRQGDLYMPGDQHYVQQADDEGMILDQESVCYFVPTILVAKGNPKSITGLSDLLRDGVRIGLGNPEACAIGRKSRKIFDKNGIAWSDVEKNLEFQSLTVNELGMQIKADALDAVIVWDATAKYYAESGDEVAIPVEQNVISTVPIGILSFTKQEQRARQFIDFVLSSRGQAVFVEHQYRVEPPTK